MKKHVCRVLLCAVLLMALLTAAASAATTLKITQQPKAASVPEGEAAKVTVKAEGDGLTYQWYFKNADDASFSLTTAFTSSFYSVTMNDDRAGRKVYCVVSDKYGNSVKTSTVTLGIRHYATIVTQPSNASAFSGERATVTLKATGDGLTYKWYFKDTDDASFARTDTFTGNTYYAPMTTDRTGRKVYCVVSDKYGNSVTTRTVTLKMQQKAAIVTKPKSVSVYSGERASATVKATGDGLTYKWYYKDINASSFKLTTAFTGATYSVEMNDDRAGRRVYCVITDKYGNSVKTSAVTLGIKHKATITQQPSNKSGFAGDTVATRVKATGDGLTYKWYYKNAGDSSFTYTSTFANNPTYSVPITSARSGRKIYCVVTDQYGNSVTTRTVTLTLLRRAKIVTQPASVTVANGAKATVKIGATGDGLTYKWYYKDATATGFKLTTSFTGASYSVEMNGARHGRQVYCMITDKYGNSVKSKTVSINMKGAVQIVAQPTDCRVDAGSYAYARVEATGDGLTYLWYTRTVGTEQYYAQDSRYDRSAYFSTLTYEGMSDQEAYCEITDQYGCTVKTNVVTLGAYYVTILKHPTTAYASKGEKITFTVMASGDGLEYSWYRKRSGYSNSYAFVYGGVPVYSFTMDNEWDGAAIYCIVSDAHGTDEWSDLGFAYLPDLKITQHPQGDSVMAGEYITTSVVAEGVGLKYQWYYKDPGDSEFKKSTNTSSKYSVKMTLAKSGRQIYCLVTDKSGQEVESATVTLTAYGPVKITKHPSDATVREDKTAYFSCSADGLDVTYQWYYKDPGSSTFKAAKDTDSSFSFPAIEAQNGRQVYCVATDRGGNTAKTEVATLTTYFPDIPVGTTICSNCDGSGDCPKCGGDMWYSGYKWIYVNGSPESVYVTELCTAVYCYGGRCDKCGGRGYE